MSPVSTDTDSGYENKARRIANEIGLQVKAEWHDNQQCPGWGEKKGQCAHIHGDRYRVTLRKGRRSLSFDFWNSQHDQQAGKEPGYYDVLSCVSSDASSPTDPDEVVEEYGEMKPSQAIAVAKHAERLQAFFTEAELSKLSDIS